MATADSFYVDPSALARLYLPQTGTRQMMEWRRRTHGPLLVTHHGRCEIVNAIALAHFRGDADNDDTEAAWAELDADFLHGHLELADLLWRAALHRAAELSRSYSAKLGTRSLDVLHVACALELELKHFLTFDERQAGLAKAVGLKVVVL